MGREQRDEETEREEQEEQEEQGRKRGQPETKRRERKKRKKKHKGRTIGQAPAARLRRPSDGHSFGTYVSRAGRGPACRWYSGGERPYHSSRPSVRLPVRATDGSLHFLSFRLRCTLWCGSWPRATFSCSSPALSFLWGSPLWASRQALWRLHYTSTAETDIGRGRSLCVFYGGLEKRGSKREGPITSYQAGPALFFLLFCLVLLSVALFV